MDISFDCANCGQHIVIDVAGAGMSVTCPKCTQQLIVPGASTTDASRISLASTPTDPVFLYTLFRGRGPAKPTQIIRAQYFYRAQKQTIEGPFNKLEMRGLMRKKIVEPETMILCPATQQWLPCERFPELPKPAYNKLLHFEKDSRFSALVQEIPRKIVEHISDKIGEGDLKNWLIKRIQECGYQCPDYDEGTINDLVHEDRVKVIISTNRQTWFGYIRFVQQGGSQLTNKPVLIGF
jgi:DNA-directed RNA polymerase subunit RPC12/RpoP